ncbi:hypothetical protein [Xenorhabdus bovienii]
MYKPVTGAAAIVSAGVGIMRLVTRQGAAVGLNGGFVHTGVTWENG